MAWVPPAVIWLGLNNQMMYAVILLGAVPSIANGLLSGVDQVPPCSSAPDAPSAPPA